MNGVTAIILAGGRAARLGGIDKSALIVGGRTLLEHATAAAESVAEEVIVVGPEVQGGPVAALASALPQAQGERILLLAADLAFADRLVAALFAAASETVELGHADGTIVLDGGGREQWLAGVYRVESLRSALEALGDPVDASMRRLLGGLDLARITVPVDDAADIDTWEDYERVRAQRDS